MSNNIKDKSAFNFFKYHAAGNDFIVLDYFSENKISVELNSSLIQKICHRQMGIGADGVVVLKSYDAQNKVLEIKLYNSDGGETSMCANGTRCALALLQKIFSWDSQKLIVSTQSGKYEGIITKTDIWLSMDSSFIKTENYDAHHLKTNFEYSRFYFADSGVPHSVFMVKNVKTLDLNRIAPPIRNHFIFPRGCNVNFLTKIQDREFEVRTFERGVEGETLSCGTGILAITSMLKNIDKLEGEILFHTPGGILKSQIDNNQISYGGAVTLVYTATLDSQYLHATR
jgi:diaminopimelate epimerase